MYNIKQSFHGILSMGEPGGTLTVRTAGGSLQGRPPLRRGANDWSDSPRPGVVLGGRSNALELTALPVGGGRPCRRAYKSNQRCPGRHDGDPPTVRCRTVNPQQASSVAVEAAMVRIRSALFFFFWPPWARSARNAPSDALHLAEGLPVGWHDTPSARTGRRAVV